MKEREIIELYNKGFSCRSISRKLFDRDDHKAITRILIKNNISIRRRSGTKASIWKDDTSE